MKKDWISPKIEDLAIMMTKQSVSPGKSVDGEYFDEKGNYVISYS